MDNRQAYEILGDKWLWIRNTLELHDIVPCDYGTFRSPPVVRLIKPCVGTRGRSNRLTLLYSPSDVHVYSDEIEDLLRAHRLKTTRRKSADEAGFSKALAELHERKTTSLGARKDVSSSSLHYSMI